MRSRCDWSLDHLLVGEVSIASWMIFSKLVYPKGKNENKTIMKVCFISSYMKDWVNDSVREKTQKGD